METKFGFSWLPCIFAIKLKDSVTLRSVRHLWYSWTYELRYSQIHMDPYYDILESHSLAYNFFVHGTEGLRIPCAVQ